MFRKFAISLLAVVSFVIGMSSNTVHAECWYFGYRQNGAGPLYLGPYPTQSKAAEAFYALVSSEARAGRRIDYVSNTLKDYCPRPPEQKLAFDVYRVFWGYRVKQGTICGNAAYVNSERAIFCGGSSYYSCSANRTVSSCTGY